MRGFRIAAVAAFVSSFVFASAPASAETKSWTVAKTIAPAEATILVSIDFTQVQQSTIYKQLLPSLIAADSENKENIDSIKASCGIDAVNTVTDITIVMDDPDDGPDAGVVLVGTTGLNEAKVNSCLKKVGKTKKKTLTTKKMGKVTELSIKGESKKLYMAWLAKDVVAIAVEPDDKVLLSKWIGGKGLSPELAATLAKVDTSAVGWLAVHKSEELEPGVRMTDAYGSVKLAAGTISGEVNLVLDSPKAAKKMAADAQKQLADAQKQLPPDFQKLFSAVKITSADATLTVKGSIAESDAMSILGLLQAF